MKSSFPFSRFPFSDLIREKVEGKRMLEAIRGKMERSGRLFWDLLTFCTLPCEIDHVDGD